MKVCRICSREEPEARFYPNRRVCKDCLFQQTYAWQAEHREKHLESQRVSKKKQYDREKEVILEKNRQWRAENQEWVAAYNTEYLKSHPEVRAACRDLREAKLRERTPSWANKEKIKQFYLEARRLTQETGIKYTVDHEIPLQGETVSGLHVENNLQILTKSENSKKRNKYAH